MTTSTRSDLESRVAALESEVAILKEKLDEADILAGIERGLDEVNHGLGRPAKEVVANLRSKYHLPRK